MDIPSAIAATKTAYEALKAIQEAGTALDKAVLKSKLADAISDLADVRMALADASEDSAKKDEEIRRLKDAFQVREEMVERYGFKFKRSPEHPDEPIGYPICLRCETVDGRIIFTVQSPDGGHAMCPQCKQFYVVRRQDGKPRAALK